MADFLDRLVQRALGVADVVQPRLVPLFAVGADLPGEEAMQTSETVLAPRVQRPMPLVGPRSVEASVQAAPDSPRDVARGEAVPRAEADQAAVEHRIAASDEAAAPVSPRGAAATQRLDEAAGEPVPNRAVRQSEPPLLLPLRALPQPSLAGDAGLAAAPPSSFAAAQDPPVDGARPVGRTPHVAPTVKVTIGRVEVRAVFPAPEAPRPAPPPTPPSLSLDQYLSQRRQGAR